MHSTEGREPFPSLRLAPDNLAGVRTSGVNFALPKVLSCPCPELSIGRESALQTSGFVCFWYAKRASVQRQTSVPTKTLVYNAVVLGVLLYGSETWTTTRNITRKLDSFHNRCLRGILGITSEQQRMERITSIQIAKRLVWRIHLKTPSLRDVSAGLDTWQE